MTDWEKAFKSLFQAVALAEPETGSQIDDALAEHQAIFDSTTGACTECGNDDPCEGYTKCSDCLGRED